MEFEPKILSFLGLYSKSWKWSLFWERSGNVTWERDPSLLIFPRVWLRYRSPSPTRLQHQIQIITTSSYCACHTFAQLQPVSCKQIKDDFRRYPGVASWWEWNGRTRGTYASVCSGGMYNLLLLYSPLHSCNNYGTYAGSNQYREHPASLNAIYNSLSMEDLTPSSLSHTLRVGSSSRSRVYPNRKPPNSLPKLLNTCLWVLQLPLKCTLVAVSLFQ